MRIIVVGGSGHIGTYLVPRLVRAGHEVINVSRGRRGAYRAAAEWSEVRGVVVDRAAEDAAGTFAATLLAHDPDVVVDMLCFTADAASALVDGLRGHVQHLVHCGSIWRYGASSRAPITEGNGTAPFDEYGIAKEEIARMLQRETAAGGLVTTSIHPGHIVGPGWAPINPLGSFDPGVWETLATGAPLRVPGSGAELLHHVHADDVAQVFELAIERRDAAAGEDFHAVAPAALTVRGYSAVAAGWFGRDASLEHVSWDDFRATTSLEHATSTWGHLHRSHCVSIEKATTRLGYAPEHASEDAILESLRWLIAHGELPAVCRLRV